jgi:hypothetical protein
VKKARINIPCGMGDTLDSYFAEVFMDGVEDHVTAKRDDTNAGAEAFPQWGGVRCLHNQETAVTGSAMKLSARFGLSDAM